MKEDIFEALDLLEKEGISKTYMIEKIEQALTSAFKKEFGPTALMRVEMDETKKNILALREKLDSLAEKRQTKENFVKAVRSFMEMKTLNPVILRELIEKIEVYQIEGTGKNRTQHVVIHYRFVGCLQIPEWHRKRKVTLESRQGVAVNYLPTTA